MEYTEKCGIYKITCLENNKVYIGSSKTLRDRLASHKNLLKKNRHENDHLQRAYNLYKIESFEFEILENCIFENIDYLMEREAWWIKNYNSMNSSFGFNKKDPVTRKITEETRLKLSLSHIGKPSGRKGEITPEYVKIILREKNLGKILTEETKNKIGEASKRHWTSESYKNKIEKSRADFWNSEKGTALKIKMTEERVGNGSYSLKYTNIVMKNNKTNETIEFKYTKELGDFFNQEQRVFSNYVTKKLQNIKGYEIISFDFKTKEGIKHIEYAKNLKEMTLDK